MGKLTFGDDEFRRLFNDAAKRYEGDNDGRVVLRNENIGHVDKLVPLIADVVPFNGQKWGISAERIRTAVRSELQARRKLDNPAQDFIEKLGHFKKTLQTLPEEEYDAWLPLPIVGRLGDPLPAFEAEGVAFEPQSHTDWDAMTAKGGQNWTHVLEQNRHELNPKKFTPYRCTVKARDPAFAAQRVTSSLRAAMGIANFCSYFNRSYPFRIGGTGSRRWSNLRSPFVFLVETAAARVLVWREDDDSYRHPHAHTGFEKKRFDEIYPQLPDLNPSDEYDALILAGFRHLQEGMTTTTFTDMFSHFWRGIEILAQTADMDPSAKNIQRMAGLIAYQDGPTLLKRLQGRVVNIRNSIIHRGDDQGLDRSDINFISATLEGALEAYMNNRGQYSCRDMVYLMDLPADEGLLKERKKAEERHIELLNETIKWRSGEGEDEEE